MGIEICRLDLSQITTHKERCKIQNTRTSPGELIVELPYVVGQFAYVLGHLLL